MIRSFIVFVFVVLVAALGIPVAASAATPAGDVISMSCFSAGKPCIGLDGYIKPPANAPAASLRTWNGKAWGPVYSTLAGKAGDSFSDLSCLSASFCVVAGDRNGATSVAPIAATWNGSGWSEVSVPAPRTSAHIASLDSVSCVSAKFCVAEGEYTPVYRQEPADGELSLGFLDIWNGTKWSLSWTMKGVQGGLASGGLGGVSCRTAASCVAVGYKFNPSFVLVAQQDQTYVAVALKWNGRTWSKTTVPLPAKGQGLLDSVSCWAPGHCVAVGTFYAHEPLPTTIVKQSPIAERWNGKKWSVTTLPHSGTAFIDGVSCVSASSCLAVGGKEPENTVDSTRSIADAWNGKAWRAIPVATPKRGTGKTGPYPNMNELGAVRCATATDCLAFGLAGPFRDSAALLFFTEHFAGQRLANIADS